MCNRLGHGFRRCALHSALSNEDVNVPAKMSSEAGVRISSSSAEAGLMKLSSEVGVQISVPSAETGPCENPKVRLGKNLISSNIIVSDPHVVERGEDPLVEVRVGLLLRR